MKSTILGSGTSTGVPMVGCACRVCSSEDPKDRRTRASLLIEHNGHNIVVDTSTDLRSQALKAGIGTIDAVLYTHSHADHVNGIDDMRGFYFQHHEKIPCFGSQETIDSLQTGFGYIFHEQASSGYPPIMRAVVISAPFELFDLNVLPVPLRHGLTSALGYRIGQMAYLTDCNAIPDDSLPLLKGLDVLVIDGLRWRPHPFHFDIRSAIAAASLIKPRRVILTHLTHEVLYAEDIEKLPDGFELAYDGMSFETM